MTFRTGAHHNMGATNPSAKLTPAQVRDIRKVYAAGGVTVRALAERYGVAHGTVGRIVSGEGWK